MGLKQIGLRDVVGVELVDSPSLLSRGDPHNLSFIDAVFDLGFSVNLDQELFPARFVRELERVVRVGGVVVVCVEECGESGVREVLRLFGRSEVVRVEVYKKTGFRTETGKKTETGFFNRFFYNRTDFITEPPVCDRLLILI
ncbi:putative S-adenosyl-L-methionine-dependent methyltransferase [Helianthus annuus]|uniref:S-adenosyl-L-methionine-dependent methyltransferase n=1 Tax=Helianthus annuus TaxID=4232 RepID=A0A251UYF3_HELAN|nr:putative S-adenosyl-L-methionine-dependent methyltransferase [Helianthus annuus]KAJ0589119.1 putative S-adenosyl-L-methionine-dependent methyltransferase [Helianthus annuus]